MTKNEELQNRVLQAFEVIDKEDLKVLLNAMAERHIDINKVFVSLCRNYKEANSVIKNNGYVILVNEELRTYAMFEGHWKMVCNNGETGKAFQCSREGIVVGVTATSIIEPAEPQEFQPLDEELQKMHESTKQFVDKKVYEVASKITQLDEKTNKLIKDTVKEVCAKGKILNGKDVPQIDLEDDANNVARLMRHLQTKSLDKEERETQILKESLIDQYSLELARVLLEVNYKVNEVKEQCKTLLQK